MVMVVVVMMMIFPQSQKGFYEVECSSGVVRVSKSYVAP